MPSPSIKHHPHIHGAAGARTYHTPTLYKSTVHTIPRSTEYPVTHDHVSGSVFTVLFITRAQSYLQIKSVARARGASLRRCPEGCVTRAEAQACYCPADLSAGQDVEADRKDG